MVDIGGTVGFVRIRGNFDADCFGTSTRDRTFQKCNPF